jgi:hypothetical protein
MRRSPGRDWRVPVSEFSLILLPQRRMLAHRMNMRMTGKSRRAWLAWLMSCATPIRTSGQLGHVPEMSGYVAGIAGRDPEKVG